MDCLLLSGKEGQLPTSLLSDFKEGSLLVRSLWKTGREREKGQGLGKPGAGVSHSVSVDFTWKRSGAALSGAFL